MSEIEVGQPENGLTNQQAEGGENHRRCNDRALKFLRDEAKQNDARRNKGKAVCVHEPPEDLRLLLTEILVIQNFHEIPSVRWHGHSVQRLIALRRRPRAMSRCEFEPLSILLFLGFGIDP